MQKKFIALGFSTELIEKIKSKKLTFSGLQGINQAALEKNGFSNSEATIIRDKVNRKPIPSRVVKELLNQTGEVCCYCSDGNTSRPYQIHHINDYANSQDHGLDNLMLVCPTHHVHIHSARLSIEEQHAVRKAWINLWEIAKDYKLKGFGFPFGAFEYMDYDSTGEVIDIFSFGPAKPSVCGKLMSGALLDRAVQMITRDNKLLLSGDSGSGKTTLSLAIGSILPNTSVFRYLVGEKESLDTMKEISLFLSFSIKPILLIIDDANTKLIGGHIEKILSLAEVNKKIITVNTKIELSSKDDIEQKVANNVLSLTWQTIRMSVKENLLNHEKEILAYLQKKSLDNFYGDKIGYSITDKKFSYVLDSYATGTNTVWQFIYMLSSGAEMLNNRMTELYARDRLDLLVYFLGVNQIATAEQGTSLMEIQHFFSSHSHFKNQAEPTIEWIESVMGDMIKSRIIKKNRDRFNLVHRMLAINFIELAYFKSKAAIEEILNIYFEQPKRIRQMLVLWSWLQSTSARTYISKWKSSRTLPEWADISDSAASDSLMSMAILGDRLHPSNEVILKHILYDKGKKIGELINKQEAGTLYNFCRLSMAIRYNAAEIWPEILDNIDQPLFFKLIKNAAYWDLDRIDLLFYAIHEGGHNSWIISLTDLFDKSDFFHIGKRIDKGDVRSFFNLLSFWRRYVENITVGDFIEYIDLLTELLRNCRMKEINFPFIYELQELFFFPDLTDNMLNVLDVKQMASDFVELTPDHWGNLLNLSDLANYTENPVIESFLNQVDIDKLMSNVKVYYLDDLYNFRLIIHQLAYSKTRGKEFSEHLKPLIEIAVSKSLSAAYQEHESILDAFSRMDYHWVKDYCVKSNISLTKYRQEVKEANVPEQDGLFKDEYKLDSYQLEALMPAYKIELNTV